VNFFNISGWGANSNLESVPHVNSRELWTEVERSPVVYNFENQNFKYLGESTENPGEYPHYQNSNDASFSKWLNYNFKRQMFLLRHRTLINYTKNYVLSNKGGGPLNGRVIKRYEFSKLIEKTMLTILLRLGIIFLIFCLSCFTLTST
jgi:hypothetical protein